MNKSLFAAIVVSAAAVLSAEEGMWTFNALPIESIEKSYGVQLDPAWINRIQKSCLRISLGGSGSFVSSQGLVLTNHHVGSRAIYNLSTEERDLMQGFLAKSYAEEIKCPNMYVDQLISIEDVTERMNQGITDAMTSAEKENARKIAMAEIKKEAQDKTGLQPQIVPLYQGALYNLYLYRRYTDLRLVMAPEKSIAFFGGDPDNFEYPRYDLDMCLFRVYENGEPLQTEHYLKWSQSGPQLQEPLFVVGNPGRTNRMLTSAHLQFLRDLEYSTLYGWLKQRRKDLQEFSNQSAENARIGAQDLFGFENSLKVFSCYYKGLTNTPLIQDKKREEQKLFGTLDSVPWTNLEAALDKARAYYLNYLVLEGSGSIYSKLYGWAKLLVRVTTEMKKPNDQRLKEYVDSELPSIQLSVLSAEPVYKSLENVLLEESFRRTVKILGPKHPVTQLILADPVAQMLQKTELTDLAYREKLYGNLEAIEASTDPFIVLARNIDPYAREVRKKKEDELDGVQNDSYTQIAKDLFKLYGESMYPDATFTLRLAYGSMKGYSEKGKQIAPITTIGGTFAHGKNHGFKDPYELPPSWMSKESVLAKSTTPFNFVSTNDIIGGNSGSPVINKNGELVGLIFDGNSESIFWSFKFSDIQGRAVSVHSAGMLEALKTVYQADSLIKEISK